MGEEESSAKDDDDDNPTNDSTGTKSDEKLKNTSPPTTTVSSTKTLSKTTNSSHSSFQSHSTPSSFASNLYALNNTSPSPGLMLFNPNTNSTGPFSQQKYRNTYPNAYPQMPLVPPVRYPNASFYVPQAVSSSPNFPIQPSMNNWYPYPPQQNPYGTQQYGHPQ